jgi:hypothetical protein
MINYCNNMKKDTPKLNPQTKISKKMKFYIITPQELETVNTLLGMVALKEGLPLYQIIDSIGNRGVVELDVNESNEE